MLLVIAILLFPVDVALRRLIFRLEDVPAWRAAVRPAPKPVGPMPVEATVSRLRERVADVRAARTARPPIQQKKPPEDPTGDLLSRRRRR
jgi:hypothetical protein